MMKKLLLFCLLALSLAGCAETTTYIFADHGATVTCTSTVHKPTDLSNAFKGNVPLQGGTVTDTGSNIAN